MYQCPLCGSENESLLCESCGFDGSQDREAYPTLARCSATPSLRREIPQSHSPGEVTPRGLFLLFKF